jgi:hypothetical protein
LFFNVTGFSKQVKQKVSGTSLLVQTLEEEVTYLVTVRAQTIDYGPAISANVTTGPQDGSPTRPKELVLGKTVSSVDMHWSNGASGKGPILGYYIQSKRKGEEMRASLQFYGGQIFHFLLLYFLPPRQKNDHNFLTFFNLSSPRGLAAA